MALGSALAGLIPSGRNFPNFDFCFATLQVQADNRPLSHFSAVPALIIFCCWSAAVVKRCSKSIKRGPFNLESVTRALIYSTRQPLILCYFSEQSVLFSGFPIPSTRLAKHPQHFSAFVLQRVVSHAQSQFDIFCIFCVVFSCCRRRPFRCDAAAS